MLPIVRKIFAICVIERTWGKLEDNIPKDQAVYQKGRNTTVRVMCMKLLIEKAITSENFNLIIMMIEMSKAFDTVNWKTRLQKLETILDESEMRMIYLLINKVKLKVRVGRSLGEKIRTKIGVAQGDSLSVLLFKFYLAQFVDVIPGLPTREDFGNNVWRSELDWLIDRDTHQVIIGTKYADDINFVSTGKTKMNQKKETAPGPDWERKSDWKWIKERRIQNTRWKRLLEKVQMSRFPNGHKIRHQP